MSKKTKKLIRNPVFLIGVILLAFWIVFAFFFNEKIGMTGNPTFIQVQTQMLPASIGIILIMSSIIKNESFPLKILKIAIFVIVASYIIYYGIGLTLISIYGLKLNFPPS